MPYIAHILVVTTLLVDDEGCRWMLFTLGLLSDFQLSSKTFSSCLVAYCYSFPKWRMSISIGSHILGLELAIIIWSSSAVQITANHQTWDVTVGLILTSKLMAFSGIWFTFLCGAWLVTSEAIILPHYAINVPDIAAINLPRCLWFAGARCYFTYVVGFLNGLLMI